MNVPEASPRFTAVVVTVSDSVFAGSREDESGIVAEKLLAIHGFEVLQRKVVPDDYTEIASVLKELADANVALAVTTGGTGFGPRDITPEATKTVIEREAPGLAELMRAAGSTKTPMAALSRGIAGTLRGTLIINLPGSPKAVKENLETVLPVLPHALDTLAGRTRHAEGAPPTQ